MMNKRFGICALLAILVLAAALPAAAVPRMQSYIVGSTYMNQVGFPFAPSMEQYSWITTETSFTYRAVGYWSSCDNFVAPPTTGIDRMEVYVVIGVPRGQTGRVWIGGTEITGFGTADPMDGIAEVPNSFYNHELMASSTYQKVYLGTVTNEFLNAYHYDHGIIGEPGWGGEIDINVTVEGFGWVHFDAVGIDVAGNTYVNPYAYDASYHGPATVVPEPGTLSLLGIGLLGMVPILRRKKR